MVSTTGTCVMCNQANCVTCRTNNVCAQCETSYTLVGSACVACNIPNCMGCSSANVCAACSGDFVATNNGATCSICLEPCATCSPEGNCVTCISPYSESPNTDGQCYTCTNILCKVCRFPNTNFCTTCITGYTATNGNCNTTCPQTSCMNCSTTNTSQCITCMSGYYINSDVQCTLCPASNCISCLANLPSVCTACSNGFYVNANNTCQECPSFCASCTSNSTCLTLNNPTGQTIVTINGTSVVGTCDPGCMSCAQNNPSSCVICLDGYYLTNHGSSGGNLAYCAPCSSSCRTCTAGSANQCTSCWPGAYIVTSSSSCVTCTPPCVTCTAGSANSCTSCPAGMILNLNTNTCDNVTNSSTCGQNCGNCKKSVNASN